MILLDDDILENEKFVRAIRLGGWEALGLWLGLKAYCAQKLTDGHIADDMIDIPRGPQGRARVKALAALKAVGLVHDPSSRSRCPRCHSTAPGEHGIWLHDYLDWSDSCDDVLSRRQANRDRQRKSRGMSQRDVARSTSDVTDPSPNPNQNLTLTQTKPKESARGAPQSVDPLMNPEETPMPSGLRERALEQGNAVDHLAKTLQVPRAVIVAELEDFCRYREAGAGMGDKRAYWLKHFRQQVLNRHKRGELKPVGLVEHEANSEARAPRKVKTLAEIEQEAFDARS